MGRYATLGPGRSENENVLPLKYLCTCPVHPEEIRLPDADFGFPTRDAVRTSVGVESVIVLSASDGE